MVYVVGFRIIEVVWICQNILEDPFNLCSEDDFHNWGWKVERMMQQYFPSITTNNWLMLLHIRLDCSQQ